MSASSHSGALPSSHHHQRVAAIGMSSASDGNNQLFRRTTARSSLFVRLPQVRLSCMYLYLSLLCLHHIITRRASLCMCQGICCYIITWLNTTMKMQSFQLVSHWCRQLVHTRDSWNNSSIVITDDIGSPSSAHDSSWCAVHGLSRVSSLLIRNYVGDGGRDKFEVALPNYGIDFIRATAAAAAATCTSSATHGRGSDATRTTGSTHPSTVAPPIVPSSSFSHATPTTPPSHDRVRPIIIMNDLCLSILRFIHMHVMVTLL